MARSEWAVVPCGTRSWAYRVGRVANIIAPATLEQVIRDEEAATWSAALDAAVAAARDEEAAARAARVLRAETIAPSTMRLFFDRVMLADAPLLDPASYVLTAALGSVARNVVHVSLPDDCGAVVELGLSGELTTGVENYTLVVAGTLSDSNEAPIHADVAERTTSFDGVGVAPAISQAASTERDIERVRVTFDEAVDDTALDIANYVITGDTAVEVLEVVRVSAREVDLIVTAQVAGGRYSLTVAGVRDLAGNEVA